MENKIISEKLVKSVIDKVLTEETSKVRREDFNRVQFKIEELQNSLNDTMREFRKLEDSIPGGLKTVCNGRVSGISSDLSNAQKLITQLKEKLRQHKRNLYSQQVDEKKK
jgi:predicted  nucleic acid-binding Zn-ribbon protein